MTPEQIARANRDAMILARIHQGPCKIADLVRLTGDKRDLVSSSVQRLIRQNKVASRPVKGNCNAYCPASQAPDTPRPIGIGTQYAMPVKRVWIQAFGVGDAAPFPVTLPAAPWEVRT